MKRLKQLCENPVELGYWSFVLALTVQVFYQVERLAQIVQKYSFSWSSAPGFLGAAVDAATVHFLYNGAAFSCVLAVWVVYFKNPGIWRKSAIGLFALTFALVTEAFHWAEQSVRLVRRAAGNDAPQGIVGHVVASIDLEFWIGSVALVALVAAYVAFRPSVTEEFATGGGAA